VIFAPQAAWRKTPKKENVGEENKEKRGEDEIAEVR